MLVLPLDSTNAPRSSIRLKCVKFVLDRIITTVLELGLRHWAAQTLFRFTPGDDCRKGHLVANALVGSEDSSDQDDKNGNFA